MREIRPHVVVTFDPAGAYGHPDHIAIHNHTVKAFHAAADPTYHRSLGEPWQARRLFYPAIDRDAFEAIADQLKAQGEEPPEWGLGEEEEGFWPQQAVHAKVDIREVFDKKMAALTSHRTQLGPNHPFMRVTRSFLRERFGQEWFELAWPERKPDTLWTDLFEGLEPDD
jgi:mycothiol S-conjugate amidase